MKIIKYFLTVYLMNLIINLTIIVKTKKGISMEKEKMVQTAKALDTFFKILKRIIMICAVVCVIVLGIFTVINFIAPDSVTGKYFDFVYIGPRTFAFSEKVAQDNKVVLCYTWIMVTASIAIISVACYAINLIRKILAPMTQGDPFHPAVGKEIRKLAFASLTIGIIQNIMNVVETLNVFTPFQNSPIESDTVNFLFDPSFLVVFFVLLLMSYIFQYGEELQKLSDETL